MSDARTRFRENVTGITSMFVTGLWLALLFAPFGGDLWLAVLLFGYVVVVPTVALLFGDEADRTEWWDDWRGSDEAGTAESGEPTRDAPQADGRAALETLRDRYAAGELTDEQFERKLDRLLETETIEDADEWARERRADRGREYDREPEGEREYEFDGA